MSGIEFIVGMVLAAVPIALEAYDRSNRVFDVFSVFRQYPREVLTLEAKLSAQRTIFRNNAINLLRAITRDRATVQEVMSQPSSKFLRDSLVLNPAYQLRQDALEESFTTCYQTAQHIQHALGQLCLHAEAFGADLGQRQENMGTSDWLKHVRRRFKLSLNKPRIEKSIADLRALNTDFGLITEQIVRTLEEMFTDQKQQPTVRKSAGYLNTLQKYYRVRFASKALYSTLQLRWACPSHACHIFDLRILDGDTCDGKSYVSHVTCKLAITHGDLATKAEKALRLEVEQACEEDGSAPEAAGHYSNTNDGEIHQLTKVLESSADRFTATSSRKRPKTNESIRIGGMRGLMRRLRRTPDVQDLNRSFANVRLDDPPSMTAAPRLARDLELVDDFCEAFHGLSINCIGRSPLGVLRDPYSQWFYLSTPQTAPSSSQSFAEVIAWVAEEPVVRTLPRSVLVELAGNLAEGIMQFYSTPWLSHPDLGQIVRFYNNSDPSVNSVQLEGPYFTTRLETRAKGKGKATDRIHGKAYGKAAVAVCSGARNELLFNFGIILLEIGFAQPWHMLKRSVSRTITGEQPSDYKTAEKLAQLLINQMGLTYPKIVKKCLGCDFGLGETDMDNEDLQRRFLEDVVSELQRLREHIREMGLYLLG